MTGWAREESSPTLSSYGVGCRRSRSLNIEGGMDLPLMIEVYRKLGFMSGGSSGGWQDKAEGPRHSLRWLNVAVGCAALLDGFALCWPGGIFVPGTQGKCYQSRPWWTLRPERGFRYRACVTGICRLGISVGVMVSSSPELVRSWYPSADGRVSLCTWRWGRSTTHSSGTPARA